MKRHTSTIAAGGTVALALSRRVPARSPIASPKRVRSRPWMAAASRAGIARSGARRHRRVLAHEPALLLDLRLKLHEAFGERLGTRRTARHVHVDRDHLVDAVAHRVRELEEAA